MGRPSDMLTRWRARLARSADGPAGGEGGFGLVDVLVSAVILVLLSALVLSALSSASKASGQQKRKATAADLAQLVQDAASVLPGNQLGVLDRVGDRTVGGQGYTVRTVGRYVQDAADGTGCTSDRESSLVQLTTTVDWPGRTAAEKPVVISGLVSPVSRNVDPDRGDVLVKVTGGDDGPKVNLLVKLVASGGTLTVQRVTNAAGCAYFSGIPTGNYQATVSQPGWVDPAGAETATAGVAVSGGTVSPATLQYDRAAQVTVTAITRTNRTKLTSTRPLANVASLLPSVSFTNSHLDTARVFGAQAATTAAGGILASGLFPFTGSYGVYAGSDACSANAKITTDPRFAAPGATSGVVTWAPASGATTVKVFEPAVDTYVTYNGAAAQGARVFYKADDEGCSGTIVRTTSNDGYVTDPGLPYGSYRVCVEFDVNANRTVAANVGTVANTDPDDTDVTAALTSSSSTSLKCPRS